MYTLCTYHTTPKRGFILRSMTWLIVSGVWLLAVLMLWAVVHVDTLGRRDDPPGWDEDAQHIHDVEPHPGRLLHVTCDQVSAARALIELRGGVENVDALTMRIATAAPRPPQ